MEIYLDKIKSSVKDVEKLTLRANIISNIPVPQGLMLVIESEYLDEEDRRVDSYQIKKLELLTIVEIESIKGNYIAAHYFDQGEMHYVILDELPNNYYNSECRPVVFNYGSYKEICELTGETPLEFKDYFESVVFSENNSVNSLERHGGMLINFDDQQKLHNR